jgi:hypothetical protein
LTKAIGILKSCFHSDQSTIYQNTIIIPVSEAIKPRTVIASNLCRAYQNRGASHIAGGKSRLVNDIITPTLKSNAIEAILSKVPNTQYITIATQSIKTVSSRKGGIPALVHISSMKIIKGVCDLKRVSVSISLILFMIRPADMISNNPTKQDT